MPGYKGCSPRRAAGSIIVEAAFTLAGVPLEVDYLSWTTLGLEHDDLEGCEPADAGADAGLPRRAHHGNESAAILMHLADLKPEAGLFPPPDHARRRDFRASPHADQHRDLPTFTYGQLPAEMAERRRNGGKGAARGDRRSHSEDAVALRGELGGRALVPGLRSNLAIDLYLWPMTWWRPGRDWFWTEAPKIHAIGLGQGGGSAGA